MEHYVPSLGMGRPPKERRTYCGNILPRSNERWNSTGRVALSLQLTGRVTYCARSDGLDGQGETAAVQEGREDELLAGHRLGGPPGPLPRKV